MLTEIDRSLALLEKLKNETVFFDHQEAEKLEAIEVVQTTLKRLRVLVLRAKKLDIYKNLHQLRELTAMVEE